MRELIVTFVDQYAVWGILAITFLAMILLWRVHRQLKKLNQSLGTVTGKIQEYFKVILEAEEPEEPRQTVESRTVTTTGGRHAVGSSRFVGNDSRFGGGDSRFASWDQRREELDLEERMNREERESSSGKGEPGIEEEEVFQAVMQEFFS